MTGEGPGIDGGMYQRKDNPGHKLNSFDCTILVDDMDRVIVAIKAERREDRGLGRKGEVGDEGSGMVLPRGGY